ncbi:MAG: PGPGW domain-containing protein [Solirubrobacteraceae bacterium]
MATEQAKPPLSERAKPPLVDRLRSRRDRHQQRPKSIRALYVVAGFTLLLAGIIMLITPGPAFVVIPVGLAILSLEFVWADRLLGKALEQANEAKRKAEQTTKTERLLTLTAGLLACAAVVAWALLGDIPLAPV